MPNWAYTQYIATGDKKKLKDLYSVMAELEQMKAPGLHENDFGSSWLGNLVIKFGGNYQETYCRGFWSNLTLEENGNVSFCTETAWGEMNEVRELIQKKFPGVRIYFQTEESRMEVYLTNDREGIFFPEKYILDVEDWGIEYFVTLETLAGVVEEITGSKNLRSFDSCKKALESYSRKRGENYCSLNQYTIL